jgi:hypothetical protein
MRWVGIAISVLGIGLAVAGSASSSLHSDGLTAAGGGLAFLGAVIASIGFARKNRARAKP